MKTVIKSLKLSAVCFYCTFAFAGPDADRVHQAFQRMKERESCTLILERIDLSDGTEGTKSFKENLDKLPEKTRIKLEECTVGKEFLEILMSKPREALCLQKCRLAENMLGFCLRLLDRELLKALRVCLIQYNMAAPEVRMVIDVLNRNKSLEALWLNSSLMTSEDICGITRGLVDNEHLFEFGVESENFDDRCLQVLTDVLKERKNKRFNMRGLGFIGNNLSGESLRAFAEALPSTLKFFSFGYKTADDFGLKALVDKVAKNSSLSFSPLGSNGLILKRMYQKARIQVTRPDVFFRKGIDLLDGSENLDSVLARVSNPYPLEQVRLVDCKVGRECLNALLAKTPYSFYLRGNTIDSETLCFLLERLATSTVQCFNFEGNKLDSRAWEYLAKMLKNKKLKVFELVNNEIDDTGFSCLLDALAENSTLERLGITMDDVHAEEFIKALIGTHIRFLSIYNKKLSDNCMCALAKGLRYIPTLIEINFCCEELGDLDIIVQESEKIGRPIRFAFHSDVQREACREARKKVAKESLKSNLDRINAAYTECVSKGCGELILEGINLAGVIGTKKFLDLLNGKYPVYSIVLKNCVIGKKCLDGILENKSVKKLLLWKCSIDPDGLGSCLGKLPNSSIEEFGLNGEWINFKVVECFENILEKGKLKTLLLRGNYISYPVFMRIMTALKNNKTLTEFGLDDNCIDDMRLDILRQVILSTNIRTLHLRDNRITATGVKNWQKSMAGKPAVIVFWNENPIPRLVAPIPGMLVRDSSYVERSRELLVRARGTTEEPSTAFVRPQKIIHTDAKLILANFKGKPEVVHSDDFWRRLDAYGRIDTLDLYRCKIEEDFIEKLVASPVFKTIKTLRLGSNPIGDRGAIALAKGLKDNTSLCELLLTYCGIGDAGAKAIFEALIGNKSLYYLGMSNNDIKNKETSFLFCKILPTTVIETFGCDGWPSADKLSNHTSSIRTHIEKGEPPFVMSRGYLSSWKKFCEAWNAEHGSGMDAVGEGMNEESDDDTSLEMKDK